MPGDDNELVRQAEAFANALSSTLYGVIGGDIPSFRAVLEEGKGSGKRLGSKLDLY